MQRTAGLTTAAKGGGDTVILQDVSLKIIQEKIFFTSKISSRPSESLPRLRGRSFRLRNEGGANILWDGGDGRVANEA